MLVPSPCGFPEVVLFRNHAVAVLELARADLTRWSRLMDAITAFRPLTSKTLT
jgi:hypothetical protein